MVTNSHRLFSKMQKYGIPKFWSQWHFNGPEIFDRLPSCVGTLWMWEIVSNNLTICLYNITYRLFFFSNILSTFYSQKRWKSKLKTILQSICKILTQKNPYEKVLPNCLHSHVTFTGLHVSIGEKVRLSHFRISSTDLKVRTTLHSIINNTVGKYCSLPLIGRERFLTHQQEFKQELSRRTRDLIFISGLLVIKNLWWISSRRILVLLILIINFVF